MRRLKKSPEPQRETIMITCANLATLLSAALIRWGGRGGGGFAFLFFGLAIVAVLIWALTRPHGNESARN